MKLFGSNVNTLVVNNSKINPEKSNVQNSNCFSKLRSVMSVGAEATFKIIKRSVDVLKNADNILNGLVDKQANKLGANIINNNRNLLDNYNIKQVQEENPQLNKSQNVTQNTVPVSEPTMSFEKARDGFVSTWKDCYTSIAADKFEEANGRPPSELEIKKLEMPDVNVFGENINAWMKGFIDENLRPPSLKEINNFINGRDLLERLPSRKNDPRTVPLRWR